MESSCAHYMYVADKKMERKKKKRKINITSHRNNSVTFYYILWEYIFQLPLSFFSFSSHYLQSISPLLCDIFPIFLFKNNCLLLSILNTRCWGTDVAHSKPTTSVLMALFTQEWVPSGTLINTPLVLRLSCGVSTGQNHFSMAMSEQVAGGTSVWSPVMDGDGAITNGSSLCALWSIWTWERTHMPWLTDAAQGLCGTMWLLDEGEGEWWKGGEQEEVRQEVQDCVSDTVYQRVKVKPRSVWNGVLTYS